MPSSIFQVLILCCLITGIISSCQLGEKDTPAFVPSSVNYTDVISDTSSVSPVHFSDGLTTLKQHGKYVIIDKQGETPQNLELTTIQRQFSRQVAAIEHFHNGLAVVMLKGNQREIKWAYINLNGKNPFRQVFDYAGEFKSGFAIVKQGEYYGIVDTHGEFRVEPKLKFIGDFKNGLALAKNAQGYYGFLSPRGEVKIDYQYEDALPFYENLAAVKKGTKWGFINYLGKMVISPQYDTVLPFHDEIRYGGFSQGLAKVGVDGYEFLINKKGNCVLGCLEN